jgi:hypothetical protein
MEDELKAFFKKLSSLITIPLLLVAIIIIAIIIIFAYFMLIIDICCMPFVAIHELIKYIFKTEHADKIASILKKLFNEEKEK